MKRIGILTFHRSINYGAYMQSFSLSNEIKKRYPDSKVEIIDFEYLSKHQKYKRKSKYPHLFIESTFKYRAFQRDLQKLPLSNRTFITNDEGEIIHYIKTNYDILIVGSDAVWAFQKMKLKNPYWLFGDDLADIVKMSYAASAYSTDFRNVDNEEKIFIHEQLKGFQYIGVRDQETFNFIQSIVPEKKIHLNHDPTFFLNPSNNEKYANQILKKNLVFTQKPIVSFMSRRMPHIDVIKNHLGSKYTFIHFSHRDKHKDVIDSKTRLLFNLSPLEWYNIYSKVLINFSQYFHGTLLGIVNHVPTFSIDDTNFDYPYVGKNEQVMSDLGLLDYFFHTHKLKNNKNELDRIISQIDYTLKNIEIEKHRIIKGVDSEREKSESFFNALQSFI